MEIGFVSRIRLPALDDAGKVAVMERLDAVETAPQRYQLSHSPALVEGLAAGDEIELAPEEPRGYRLVRQGGNMCVWFVLPEANQGEEPNVDRVRSEVELLGGRLDGIAQRVVVLTIPAVIGLTAIEYWLTEVSQRYPGAVWMYGNVSPPQAG